MKNISSFVVRERVCSSGTKVTLLLSPSPLKDKSMVKVASELE